MTQDLRACLDARVTAGAITKAQADEAYELVKHFEREGASPGDAAARAAQRLADDAIVAKRQRALQIQKAVETEANARSHPRNISAGVAAIFARDLWQQASYPNIEARYRAVLRDLQAKFSHGLTAYRLKTAGLSRDTIGLRAFVRELFEENSGNPTARSAALGWRDATDSGVALFNAAGGNLRRKEAWRLPQHWDKTKVDAMGEEAFREEMLSAMDNGRLQILDYDTGSAVTREKAVRIIDDAFQRIVTDGLVDLTPGQAGMGKVANRRTAPRAFEWTSSEAWFEFNDKFGVGEARLFDLLTGHLDGMARDIAQMQVLGPNPQAQARRLIDIARKSGGTDGRPAKGWQVYHLESLWDYVSGKANSPVSERMAGGFRSVRAWLTSAQLGSATVSSVTDFATTGLTARWNGLPAARVMRTYLDFMTGGEQMRARAIRAGLGAEGWTQRAAGAHRHQAEIIGYELPVRISDFAMKASLLTPHTESLRYAMGWEMLSHMTELAEAGGWERVPAAVQRALGRYGIEEADWNLIRGAGLADLGDGVKMLDHMALARQGRAEAAAAAKLQQMISTEQDFAVPTPGALERTLMQGKLRPGTLSGEFLKSTLQYKTFPVTIMAQQLMRGLNSLRAGDRGAYLAALAVSTTMMGALAWQLKNIANGRDPQPMDDPRFWAAAFVQGGAAGILGDFFYSGTNRAGRSFWMTIAGPTAGLVEDAIQLTTGNIPALASEEDDTNFGRELARFTRRYTPLTSLWYTRLAMDRLMWNRMQELLDPRAPQDWRRLERRRQDEFDQDYFWAPGQTAPERGPDLSASVR